MDPFSLTEHDRVVLCELLQFARERRAHLRKFEAPTIGQQVDTGDVVRAWERRIREYEAILNDTRR